MTTHCVEPFWGGEKGDENVLELESDNAAQLREYTKKHCVVHFKK